MRKFLGSLWFPFLACLVTAATTTAAFALLKPTGDSVGNMEVVRVFVIAGWVTGGVMGIVSFVGIGILNLLRRMLRLRRTDALHPIVVLAGTLPWFVWAWVLLDEPPFTAFARAAMEFVARPMLWGGLAGTLFVVVMSCALLFPTKK